jgi:hypothetical protein
MLAFVKLFSDVDRLKVAGLLATGPSSLDKIAAVLAMPGKEALHHVSVLVQAGFAVDLGGGTYEFLPRVMEDLAHRLLAGSRPTHKVEGANLAEDERKVLADFTSPDGRLKRLPAQQKKCEIILRYVCQVFQPGERYSEKQVNEMLRRFHDDTAALRRGLIDYHLMSRQAGIYWRIDEASQ